ncbi:(2Fe-2S)-binding protein [bacterium]|nr:(2Fe-2S)-binding protein [bacterium]
MAKVNLTIDGQSVDVEEGTNLIEAARQIGVEVPHYCYHPGLKIDGNCRMCLVDIEKSPKPQIACNTKVAPGMVVHTQTDKVKKMRASVMEFLLINHPLDCPTCDQAGECRLQDYYMKYDRIPSRFEETKVHKDKMIDLGSSVMLDQERCIACTRCIRFCRDVAGQDELALANRGDHVTITTFPGKKLSNPYAGNVVDICPVGALTSDEFRFKKRVWYLKRTPSVCTGCSRGCNIEVHHEGNKIYRLIPRYNPNVNQYWMCDEGRHGYHFVNDNRVLRAQIIKNGAMQEVSFAEAAAYLASQLKTMNSSEIATISHAGETNEVLKAFDEFSKNVLKTDLRYYSRNEVKNPSSDTILRTADKNPNQAYINDLKLKPVSEIKNAQAALVLNGLSEADFEILKKKNIPILAIFAANVGDALPHASVVCPIPTFAEQDGHLTNVNAVVQKISQAFAPRGESRLVGEWLDAITLALGMSAKKAEAVSVF